MLKVLFILMLPLLILGGEVSFQDTVVTKSGKEYVGRITDLEEDNVKIDLGDGVMVAIEIANVAKIIFEKTGEVYNSEKGFKKDYHYYEKYVISARNGYISEEKSIQSEDAGRYRPGDHEVIIMPTAYTMEKGESYITDYELYFLNYTYAITSSTHIGATIAFPIMKEFYKTFSIGIKQNYLEYKQIAGALFATYVPEVSGYVFGNTFSIGNSHSAFHLGIGGVGSEDMDHVEPLLMLGGTINASDMISILLEYDNSKTWLDKDFNGLLTVGVRFRSRRMSWEIAAIRPMAEDTGDLLFLPWLKATLVFGMEDK